MIGTRVVHAAALVLVLLVAGLAVALPGPVQFEDPSHDLWIDNERDYPVWAASCPRVDFTDGVIHQPNPEIVRVWMTVRNLTEPCLYEDPAYQSIHFQMEFDAPRWEETYVAFTLSTEMEASNVHLFISDSQGGAGWFAMPAGIHEHNSTLHVDIKTVYAAPPFENIYFTAAMGNCIPPTMGCYSGMAAYAFADRMPNHGVKSFG